MGKRSRNTLIIIIIIIIIIILLLLCQASDVSVSVQRPAGPVSVICKIASFIGSFHRSAAAQQFVQIRSWDTACLWPGC